MAEITGWLLDLYESNGSLALWIMTDDDRRLCLQQAFPVQFYVAGPGPRLRQLWRWLQTRPNPPALGREERRDLFQDHPIAVLRVEVEDPGSARGLFMETEESFPDLVYYDADLQIQVRHAARYGSFPLVRCRLDVEDGVVKSFAALDSPWEIDSEPPPLRVMEINLPDGDPHHAPPAHLELRYRSWKRTYPFPEGNDPVFWLRSALQQFDPDILLTDYGDTWLLENLLRRVNGDLQQLPLNRDPARAIRILGEKTYFSYGQVVYRGQQIHLFGRIHIDRKNAMLWGDYELEGALENARVTALPIQTAARVSPGSGISCMQMITALRNGVLIPWHKQQVEQPRSMLDLLHADFGGLIYQPTVGLHRDVGAIDFVSLYPAVMVRCNISPEKQAVSLSDPLPPDPGLIPQTLAPLLQKRVLLKQRILQLPSWDPRRKWYKARSAAQKWLLVVCFGYLGYKNARFGLIGSHEAVTSGGREAVLRAKEAAEDAGFEILHVYVDGLWIQQAGFSRPEDFQPVLEEVTRRTGLPIALDGVYRWVVFLPSRLDSRVPVPNRYFGVFQDGTVKVRGLASRRRDSPAWVSETQMALIEYLARVEAVDQLAGCLPGALRILRQALDQLRQGRVPPEKLLLAQRLTRLPEKYRSPSPAARAAMQIQAAGGSVQAGQRVRFLFVRGQPGVWAWDCMGTLDPRRIDLGMYRKLLLRAASDVFHPFGIDLPGLELRVADQVSQAKWFTS